MKRQKTTEEIYKKIRRDWGQVKPYTRIEQDKRKKKPKHKKSDADVSDFFVNCMLKKMDARIS